MSRKIFGACLLSAVVMMMAAGARADDTEYTVKLTKAEKVGDKYAVSEQADLDQKVVASSNGTVVKSEGEQRTADLEGTVEVMAVDAQSRETGMHLVVKKLTSSVGGAAATEPVPAGSEIDIAYKDKKAEFTMKGGDLSDDAKKALDTLFHAPTSDKTEDVMFGTKDKQKIGAEWKPNLKAMAEDLSSSGQMEMDPEKMTGTVKLVDAKTVDGVPMLEVQATMESTDMSMPGAGKAKEAKLTANFGGTFPAADSATMGNMQMKMSIHAIFDVPASDNSPAVTVAIDMSMKAKEARTPVK